MLFDLFDSARFFSSKDRQSVLKSDLDFLGGKGYHLCKMSSLGVKVPPGFVVSNSICADYYENSTALPDDFIKSLIPLVSKIEAECGLRYGSLTSKGCMPLLLSVRSGSKYSMPGMMDTVLNVGLNEDIVLNIIERGVESESFVLDTYLRFVKSYASSVFEIKEEVIKEVMASERCGFDQNISLDSIISLKNNLSTIANKQFPNDVWCQLKDSIKAVFDSWKSERAIGYRGYYNISNSKDSYTAVTVQKMVFGNRNLNSFTGVVFSRNPSDGSNCLFGEYLTKAQGEDIVSGSVIPKSISKNDGAEESLELISPKIFSELFSVVKMLELKFQDMQDVEFTVDDGELWILQSRSGKRNNCAEIKIAADLCKEGVISEKEAIFRISSEAIENLFYSSVKKDDSKSPLFVGSPASYGAAFGRVAFTSEEAEEMASRGIDVVLFRPETSPEDLKGICSSVAVVTSRGGMTSHAAVVARGMRKPCICGSSDLYINCADNFAEVKKNNGVVFKIDKGSEVTVDGKTGEVFLGLCELEKSEIIEEFFYIMNLVTKYQSIKVRANADTARDLEVARQLGACGVGLCRTEHMFFETNKLDTLRKLIVGNRMGIDSTSLIDDLVEMQIKDFTQMFLSSEGCSINIRLLDPPLHEFIVYDLHVIKRIADGMGISFEETKALFESIKESNPMLGTRGVRLGVVFPEIYKAQALAIFKACCNVFKLDINFVPNLEIMVPFVFSGEEMLFAKNLISSAAEHVFNESGVTIKYSVGSMVELPRAALLAGEIAKHADFLSFGTNDLTQTVLGISRDDSYRFMKAYRENKILTIDPFVDLDESGVGELIKIACLRAREVNPLIKIGICGEHACSQKIIPFLNTIKPNYISCSTYKVPTMKFAIASTDCELQQKEKQSLEQLKEST